MPLSGRPGDPVAVSWGGRRVDVFARSADDRLEHWWTDPGDGAGPPESEQWYGPERLAGVLRGDPVAVCTQPERIDVFARGADASLLHWWWDNGSRRMFGPESRGDWALVTRPVAVSSAPERVDVFARGTLGGMLHWSADGNSWNAASHRSNLDLSGEPVAAAIGPGHVAVVAPARDGIPTYFHWYGDELVDSYDLGARVGPDLVAASSDPTRLDIFATDLDGRAVHFGCDAPFERDRWSGPEQNLPAGTPPVSAASSDGPQHVDIFGAGDDRSLVRGFWDAAERVWYGPFPLAGRLAAGARPAPLVTARGTSVYARAQDGGLQRWIAERYDGGDEEWRGPQPLTPAADPPPAPTGWRAGVPADPTYLLIRPRDLVVLGVGWSGCELTTAGLRATGPDARVLLTFPPQHVGEEVAPAGDGDPAPTLDPAGTGGYPVWQSRLAGPSRVAFRLPPAVTVPLTAEALLGALDRAEVLPGTAPADHGTAVELPWGLIARPGPPAGGTVVGEHPAAPVGAGDTVGLWRTRLRPAGDGAMSLVPLDSGPADPFALPLRQAGRQLIAAQSTPAALDRLELSALGGTLSARGTWPELEWDHDATLGRDQTVRLLARGRLYPFGHRAELLEVSDRTLDPDGAKPVAVLRSRTLLTVTEPVRRIDDPAVLRLFPFTAVEITTTGYELAESPTITKQRRPADADELRERLGRMGEELDRLLHEVDADWVGGPITVESSVPDDPAAVAYLQQYQRIEDVTEQLAVLAAGPPVEVPFYRWPHRPAGVPVPFPVRLAGPAGDVHAALPMMFVYNLNAPATPALGGYDSLATDVVGELARPYADVAGTVPLGGVLVDLVHRPDGGAAAAGDVHEVHWLNISGDAAGREIWPRLGLHGGTSYLGHAAGVALPALRALTGDARVAPVGWSAEHAGGGPADVVLRLAEQVTADFAGNADRAGGLIAPTLALNGISRTKGLANVAALAGGDPAALLAGTRLLGFDLATLLRGVTTTPDLLATLSPGQPPTVSMTWPTVSLTAAGPFRQIAGRPQPRLDLTVHNGPTETRTECVLRDVELAFPDGSPLVRIQFGSLAFTQLNGRPPALAVTGVAIVLSGILDLLQVLQENVDLGPAAPAVEVTGAGVTARYALPVPDVAVGAFVLRGLTFGATVHVPFDVSQDAAPSVALGFGSRERPFLLSVLAFGGGGYVDIEVDHSGLRRLEIALEFGALAAVDFLLVTAEVHVLGGIRFALQPNGSVELTGFVHLGGSVEIFGLVSVSVDLRISLGYRSAGNRLVGQATLVVEVDLTLFSESVALDSGVWEIAGSDPAPPAAPARTFAAGPAAPDPLAAGWLAYRKAFTG